ncbi:hypothetical protein VTL71DRAFT_10544 [Oculimacula yallundae]|uniref:Clr5 domain-containing protein n=1 Tax=Oculimacula yallundae TaxID=86028 RepID=A0ABR4CTE2_9HELO
MSFQYLPAPSMNVLAPATSSSNAPTRDDWNRHRNLLTQLWSVENKKLDEVMAIMTQHGHIATKRMYKYHFQIWKLDKKFKERDAVAMLRKKTQRDAVGKQTAFKVRGKALNMKDLARYLERRKETPIGYGSRASTPSDIECQTPPPTVGFQIVDDIPMGRPGVPAMYFDNEYTIRKTGFDETFSTHLSRISRSPSPPQSLMIPEQLFYYIKSYTCGSWNSGIWVTDETGLSTTLDIEASTQTYHSDFLTCCNTAVTLLDQGLLVEFRRKLSRGFSFIKDMLRIPVPDTLNCILSALVHFMQKNRLAIAFTLRNYISQMAIEILPKEHPWSQICRSLGTLDIDIFEEVITQSWKCELDISTGYLGLFSRSSIGTRLEFIRRVYGSKDVHQEGKMLQELLKQAEIQVPSASPRAVSSIMVKMGYNLTYQERYSEAEKIGKEILSWFSRDGGSVDVTNKIEALRLVAECQYLQYKDNLAEMNLKEALRLAVEAWGPNDAFATEIALRLETWLREWGREDEADELKAQRDRIMDLEEMDEGLDAIVV